VGVHTYNPNIQEVEAGGLGVWGQPGLLARPCIKKTKTKPKPKRCSPSHLFQLWLCVALHTKMQIHPTPPQCTQTYKENLAGHWWLTPEILFTQEVEIRRIMVQSQPGQRVHETLSWKYTTKGWWGGLRCRPCGEIPVMKKKECVEGRKWANQRGESKIHERMKVYAPGVFFLSVFFLCWQYWSLNSEPHTSKCSTTWITLPALLLFVCFSDRVSC
jgi:hypothetical protein